MAAFCASVSSSIVTAFVGSCSEEASRVSPGLVRVASSRGDPKRGICCIFEGEAEGEP